MLPDVSSALVGWVTPHTVKALATTTTDFVQATTTAARTVQAMAQPSSPEQLATLSGLDWSMKHYTVHCTSALEIGEIIVINGGDYKIITDGAWMPFGYSEVVAEQTKRTAL